MHTLSLKTSEVIALLNTLGLVRSQLMRGSASMAVAVAARQLETVYAAFTEQRDEIMARFGGRIEGASLVFDGETATEATEAVAELLGQSVEVRLPVLSDEHLDALTLTPEQAIALLPLTAHYL